MIKSMFIKTMSFLYKVTELLVTFEKHNEDECVVLLKIYEKNVYLKTKELKKEMKVSIILLKIYQRDVCLKTKEV